MSLLRIRIDLELQAGVARPTVTVDIHVLEYFSIAVMKTTNDTSMNTILDIATWRGMLIPTGGGEICGIKYESVKICKQYHTSNQSHKCIKYF